MMAFRCFLILLSLLFSQTSVLAQSELGGGGNDPSTPVYNGSEAEAGTCTSAQIQENRNIINQCRSNWSKWGIEPPPAEELREANDCSGMLTGETLLGCGDAILALPVFLGQLAVAGIAATLPVDRNTFAYVSQNGSLEEIQAFLTGEFIQERCGLYPWQVNVYAAEQCPDREAHLDSQAHQLCRREAVKKIQEYTVCRRSSELRALYQENRSSLDSQARQIKAEQDQRRALESRREEEISGINSICRAEMRALSGSQMMLVSPFLFLTAEAQRTVAPTQSQVQRYTDCIERQTEGKPELRDELINAADGFVAQISRSMSSLKCYNGRIRKALMCEIALTVLSGGGALSAAAARRLGRNAVEDFQGRFGRRAVAASDESPQNVNLRIGDGESVSLSPASLGARSDYPKVENLRTQSEVFGEIQPSQIMSVDETRQWFSSVGREEIEERLTRLGWDRNIATQGGGNPARSYSTLRHVIENNIEAPQTSWAYHGTSSGIYDSLLSRGLNNSAGPEAHPGVMMRLEDRATFSTFDHASMFASSAPNTHGGRPMLLRFPTSRPIPSHVMGTTDAPVPPELMEYSVDGGTTWYRLIYTRPENL